MSLAVCMCWLSECEYIFCTKNAVKWMQLSDIKYIETAISNGVSHTMVRDAFVCILESDERQGESDVIVKQMFAIISQWMTLLKCNSNKWLEIVMRELRWYGERMNVFGECLNGFIGSYVAHYYYCSVVYSRTQWTEKITIKKQQHWRNCCTLQKIIRFGLRLDAMRWVELEKKSHSCLICTMHDHCSCRIDFNDSNIIVNHISSKTWRFINPSTSSRKNAAHKRALTSCNQLHRQNQLQAISLTRCLSLMFVQLLCVFLMHHFKVVSLPNTATPWRRTCGMFVPGSQCTEEYNWRAIDRVWMHSYGKWTECQLTRI